MRIYLEVQGGQKQGLKISGIIGAWLESNESWGFRRVREKIGEFILKSWWRLKFLYSPFKWGQRILGALLSLVAMLHCKISRWFANLLFNNLSIRDLKSKMLILMGACYISRREQGGQLPPIGASSMIFRYIAIMFIFYNNRIITWEMSPSTTRRMQLTSLTPHIAFFRPLHSR